MSLRFDLPDLAATEAFASRLARALRPPLVIGLVGDLGAGKTALVRALIQALVPGTRVKSPTYTLVESYELPAMQIHHLDLYRVRYPEELGELGLAELLTDDAVFLIEWPDKGGDQTPAQDLQITLSRVDENARTVALEALSEAGRRLCATISGQ